MKLNRIIIKNIGIIEDADIILDKPLNIFSGGIKQGKTTILNSIKWSCGGKFPSDILKHGKLNGSIRLEFDNNDSIERKFFMNSKNEIKAKQIEYISNGVLQDKPVDKLKLKFNPFQIDQNHFTNMNAIDKRRFLVDHFNVDTTKEDKELIELKEKGKELRSEVDGYVPLKLEEVKPVDEKSLIEQKRKIEEDNQKAKENSKFNEDLESRKNEISKEEIELLKKLDEIKKKKEELNSTPLKEVKEIKETSDIDEKIQEAKLTNYKAEQYKKSVMEEADKAAEIQEKRSELDRTIQLYKEKEREKQNKLIEINKTHGIEGLVFIEGGNFTFENTSAEMLSTSQNAKLSSLLQSKYPDSFAFEVIDQGESWGNSIYDLISKAKEENKTILVTKVDEKPAKSTNDANVFVVENGKVKLNN